MSPSPDPQSSNLVYMFFFALAMVVAVVAICIHIKRRKRKLQNANKLKIQMALDVLENVNDADLFMANLKLRYTSRDYNFKKKYKWLATILRKHAEKFILFNVSFNDDRAETRFRMIKLLLQSEVKEHLLYGMVKIFLADLVLDTEFYVERNVGWFDISTKVACSNVYAYKYKMEKKNVLEIVFEYEFRIFLRDF
ncbi:hypothetical protein COBT_003873, partial [Conglomerata obtusa]